MAEHGLAVHSGSRPLCMPQIVLSAPTANPVQVSEAFSGTPARFQELI